MKLPYLRPSVAALALGGIILVSTGCGGPNPVNVALRRENQSLHNQVDELQKRVEGDRQIIAGLRDRSGSLPTLPTTRLSELFTTHGLEFGRLTGGADLDPNKPGDEGFTVYIVPVDQAADKLKAAGTFDVDAFDLADLSHPLVGHWHFDVKQATAAWTNVLIEYNYALICPWQDRVPVHPDLTIKISFFDILTQTPFTAQKVIHVNLPPKNAAQG